MIWFVVLAEMYVVAILVAPLEFVAVNQQCDEAVAPVIETLSVVAAVVVREATSTLFVTATVRPLDDRVNVRPAPAVSPCS